MDEWKEVLLCLTPGGSEFSTPQECAEWINTRMASLQDIIKKDKIQRNADRVTVPDHMMRRFGFSVQHNGVGWMRYFGGMILGFDQNPTYTEFIEYLIVKGELQGKDRLITKLSSILNMEK